MKKLIVLMVLLFTVNSFAQWGSAVRTSINYNAVQIYNSMLDGVEYSDAFSLKGRQGIMTLAMDIDTTSATIVSNQSDSCYTLGFQLYFDGIGWSTYYNDRTTYLTVTFTKIDTVSRALQSGENLLINIATATTEDALADSMRFVHFIGSGDSANVILELRQE